MVSGATTGILPCKPLKSGNNSHAELGYIGLQLRVRIRTQASSQGAVMKQPVAIGLYIAAAVSLGLWSGPAAAQQHCSEPQLGTWKLKSDVREDVKTGQKTEGFGAHPTGFITYGADCRVQVIIIADGRKTPANLVPTDAERIELYSGLEAYAGTYSIKGDIVSH